MWLVVWSWGAGWWISSGTYLELGASRNLRQFLRKSACLTMKVLWLEDRYFYIWTLRLRISRQKSEFRKTILLVFLLSPLAERTIKGIKPQGRTLDPFFRGRAPRNHSMPSRLAPPSLLRRSSFLLRRLKAVARRRIKTIYYVKAFNAALAARSGIVGLQ